MIAGSLRLPEEAIGPRLRTELSLALLAQGILSFGKASELAEMLRAMFAEAVTQRDIPRLYSEQESTRDLDYARGQKRFSDLGFGLHRTLDAPAFSIH